MNNKIPEKVVNRLIYYYFLLDEYTKKEIEFITSLQIATRLGIDDSQVRKDFKKLDNSGICRKGYVVKDLKKSIENILCFQRKKDAFIIGAGHLGQALAKYKNFSNYGLNIIALFDNDPLKINLLVGEKQIFHIAKLNNLANRLNVDTTILTVPKHQAQHVTNILVEAGIKYIWNFTSAILQVPDEIKVCNQNLAASFLQFAYKYM